MQLPSKQHKELEYLSGLVERITFHNEENGFAILKVKVSRKKDLVAVSGTLPSISVGENIQAQGFWVNDAKYGLQFKAEFIKSVMPNTLEGIEKYLGSGLIKGIGPHFAKKLVDAFKEVIFEVIENTPELLKQVEGIGTIRVKKITSSWAEQKIVRDIMVFLQSHGVSTSKATRIYKTYGDDAIKVVADNPYKLARDISGIGFISADKIARNIGIAAGSIIRARAGVNHVLAEALSEGHCGLPKPLLIQNACKLLSITDNIIIEALEQELKGYNLVEDRISEVEEAVVFLGAYYTYENQIAAKLKKIAKLSPKWKDIDSHKAIEWVEEKLRIKLADNQKLAINEAISSSFIIITGGPGTGKTTLLKSLLKILKTQQVKIMLCAPTGRAAKRLSESTGIDACTIHRLLCFNPAHGKFDMNEDNPLKCDLLIIDESSMVDVALMNNLLKALPEGAGLMMVGDVDQLPSVGPGQVLKDIIDSETFKVAKLTQIFRQAQDSNIITNAYRINQGLMPKLELSDGKNDFYFIESSSPEDTVAKIIQLVSVRIPRKFGFNAIEDIQVLTPMQRGGCGAISLNIALQEALNMNLEQSITKFGQRYSIGDKVMQTENNYDKEVYNGDIGIIKNIDVQEQEVLINFDYRDIIYAINELDEITLAYAITIHKSQGSEYPAVVMPINMQHYMMLRKNLLYTGVTRGKRLVVLVGEKKAISIAVKSRSNDRRFSRLRKLLS